MPYQTVPETSLYSSTAVALNEFGSRGAAVQRGQERDWARCHNESF